MSKEEKPKTKTPTLLSTIVSITIILSLVFFFLSFEAFAKGEFDNGLWLALIGIIGLGVSTFGVFLLLQTRKAVRELIMKPQKVLTELLCQKCGFKNVREFQRGDYILQVSEPCPKCNEKMIIDSIYHEVTEEEKSEA